MLLPNGTIVAVVDGEHLELYQNTGDDVKVQLSKMAAPKLDSQNHSGGGRQSSVGNHADKQVEEDAHAIAVVNWLNSQVIGHKIEHLVVFAAPRTLGEMRRHYHKQTEAALLKEFHKDYIGRPPSDIIAALREKH
jgi:protein required for attachment to host cells